MPQSFSPKEQSHSCMFDSESLVPKTDHHVLVAEPPARQQLSANDIRQRRLMVIALTLLLSVLGLAIYANRGFWFPDTQEADSDQPAETAPAATALVQPSAVEAKPSTPAKPKHRAAPEAKSAKPETSSAPVAAAATTNRTELPPLEVEVVAGDQHSTIRPGTNSVRVDLQPGAPTQTSSDTASAGSPSQTAAAVTYDAAERVQISADAAEVVSRPVRPGYPLLARQMKVQGSVILQALIGKDGIIQDLRVISGPPILATAAQTAVKQWHFKPHFQGGDAVETQAKITVNFTISTN
jgi:TonB family protein